MGTLRGPRTLVAPGFRSAQGGTLRSAVGTALSTVLGDPALWALGALGFAARGGLLVLALPIITVPSPVTVAFLLRDHISTAGPTPALTMLITAILVGFGLCVLAGLLLAAVADVAAFERFVRDPETEESRGGRVARPLSIRRRRRLILWLAGVQAVLLVPAGVALAVAAERIEPLVRAEVLSPSAFDVPLFLRLAFGLRESLAVIVVALVVADLLSAIVSRRILAHAVGLLPEDGVPPRRTPVRVALDGGERLIRRPVRTLLTLALAWLATFAVIVPVGWGLLVAWGAVRGLYLTPFAVQRPDALLGTIIVTVVLAAIWLAAVILAGFASGLRGALWTAASLD